MKKLLNLLAASSIATVITAGAAFAQSYPTSIVGTWTIIANNTHDFKFTVQTQSSDSHCAQITGTFSTDSLLGYYCPATGLVSIERNASNSGVTFQVYTGSLSTTGSTLRMTGSFANYDNVDNNGNDVGAYAFTATLPGS